MERFPAKEPSHIYMEVRVVFIIVVGGLIFSQFGINFS